MRGNPGFRFHDNQDSFFDRDVIHKREMKGDGEVKREEGDKEDGHGQMETVFETWEDWGDFDEFGGLRDEAAVAPRFGLFDRTILTRVQKKNGNNVDMRDPLKENKDNVNNEVEEKGMEDEIKTVKKSLPSLDIKTDSSQQKLLV